MASSSSTFERPKRLGVNCSFFSTNRSLDANGNQQINSLEEMALHSIFDQCDFNVTQIAAFISSQNNEALTFVLNRHIPHIKRIFLRVNTLCNYIVNADLNGAKDFLDANKSLLPLLFKFKTTVKSQRGHLYVNCNALQLLMKTGDVGREGCELYLTLEAQPENTSQEKLFLYSDVNDANSPLRYMVDGLEQTIQLGENKDQLKPDYFNTLKAMYRDGLMDRRLYLSTQDLNATELKAYVQLLIITKNRGHTKFVKEDAISEMIRQNYFKGKEFEFESLGQLSKEELAQAQTRRSHDKEALQTIFKAISGSLSKADCAKTLETFKRYLQARLAAPATTFDVDCDLFLSALTMAEIHAEYVQNFGYYYGRKSDLVFDHVIGPIQDIQSIVSQMAMAQGIHGLEQKGDLFIRTLNVMWTNPLVSISDFLSASGWLPAREDVSQNHFALRTPDFFLTFFKQKQVMCRLMQRVENLAQDSKPMNQLESTFQDSKPKNQYKRCVIL